MATTNTLVVADGGGGDSIDGCFNNPSFPLYKEVA